MTKTKSAQWNREDRDLLVELRTEMSGVRSDIKDLKDNFSIRVAALESSKHDRDEAEKHIAASAKTHEDYETRMKALEIGQAQVKTWGGAALIFMAVAELAIKLFWK